MQANFIVEIEIADPQIRYAGKAAWPTRNRVPFEKDAVHDEVEAKGGHGQIVPGKAQHRNANQQGDATDDGTDQHHGRPGGEGVGPCGNGRAVCSQAEERGMAERNLPGIADKQIQPEHHNGIDGNQVGHAKGVGIIFKDRKEQ